jgi:hypothetical protein
MDIEDSENHEAREWQALNASTAQTVQCFHKFQPFFETSHHTPEPLMEKVKIFVSYCSADRELREYIVEELNVHLKNYEGFTFTLWDDTAIDLGADWETTIENAMAECQAALLLVSPKFAASKYITEKELVEFFKRKKEEGFLIMPMLLRKYNFSRLEQLAKLNFFKTYHSEYGYSKPLLRNKLIPFDKLAEDENITDEKLNLYFNKLGEFIHTAVKNKFEKLTETPSGAAPHNEALTPDKSLTTRAELLAELNKPRGFRAVIAALEERRGEMDTTESTLMDDFSRRRKTAKSMDEQTLLKQDLEDFLEDATFL